MPFLRRTCTCSAPCDPSQDCYQSRCVKYGQSATKSFPGACLSGCQWRAGRTEPECEKFCDDAFRVQKMAHTVNDGAYYVDKLVESCKTGCGNRCNGMKEEKAVGCLQFFSGGVKGQCNAQQLRRLR